MDFLHTAEGYADTYYWQEKPISSKKKPLDMLALLQRLHASLDPRTVFASYGKQLQSALPLYGVTLHDHDTPLKWGRTKGIKLTRTVLLNDVTVQLDYFLSMPLNISETVQLDSIEPLLSQPLANAYRHQKVAEQAMLDSLTGLGNRFFFNQALKNATARAERAKATHQVSLLILDLDNFKQLNDSKGHREGDKALMLFADIVRNSIRSADQAFRLGGDEFVIIAEGKSDSAHLIAERILQQTADDIFLQSNKVSCSIGISLFDKQTSSDEQLFEQADNALYRAKSGGRNRYCLAARQ
ncbi:hypothetical protein HR45_12420 [Shewanella mangrovi]|uniref:diguanylate cyclase n=1 Tax=Shewanella mangrovi TaxID=1515746 RepID=A0A094JXN8_9GAMM|nr:GGDEF domain-containing protein [Shewanella mangrovi]KFZ37206.1 hypothetical protein HR45_12420 [Shewanella mangrovi]